VTSVETCYGKNFLLINKTHNSQVKNSKQFRILPAYKIHNKLSPFVVLQHRACLLVRRSKVRFPEEIRIKITY